MTQAHDLAMFVQVGATRDGLDPYLHEARRRSMTTILVETPAYLRLRRGMGRQPFDIEIGLDDPSSPDEVCRALGDRAPHVKLLLGGFERYNACAHASAHALGITLARDARHHPFLPPDKAVQRVLLSERAPAVAQPDHVTLSLDRIAELAAMIELKQLRYPLVVKPSDGGGGLGVFLVDGPTSLAAALAQLRAMTNYGGGAFACVIAEEFIEGTEFSIQGVAFQGAATVLTTCEKLIVRERTRATSGISGFREAAHIAQPGSSAPDEFRVLAQRCIEAMNYTHGPFHVDFIRNRRGNYFVEMGFRLSGGGIVGLVERTTGLRWADLVFDIHLEHRPPAPALRSDVAVGLATLANDAELAFFRELRTHGDAIELQQFSTTGKIAPVGDDDGDDAQLASDRRRHVGFKGRVFLEARDPAVIRQRLENGIHTRLENGTCVD